jgi:hypothetical protein
MPSFFRVGAKLITALRELCDKTLT